MVQLPENLGVHGSWYHFKFNVVESKSKLKRNLDILQVKSVVLMFC